MKRLVLFDSIEMLRREKERLEEQYKFEFSNVVSDLNFDILSHMKDSIEYAKEQYGFDIRRHMKNLIGYTDCYPLFFSNVEDPRDAYAVLYSNGLACAILSLSYLQGEAIEKVNLCNEWNSKDKRFISASVWSRELTSTYFQRRDRLIENNIVHLACPYTYLPADYRRGQEESFETNKLLLPLYQKIAGDIITPDENGSSYNIEDVFDNHILSLYKQNNDCLDAYQSPYGKNADVNFRAHKSRLKRECDIFYKALLDQLYWENGDGEESFSTSIMLRFASELIYHSEAIARLEWDLTNICQTNDSDRGGDKDKEIMDRLMKFAIESSIPMAFHVDKLKYSDYPPLGAYYDYLKALTVSLYEYAEGNLDTACALITEIISKERDLFPDPYRDSKCIADSPAEFPNERKQKHWLIVKAAAVCECYKEKNYYNSQRYPLKLLSPRELFEIQTETNHPPLAQVSLNRK